MTSWTTIAWSMIAASCLTLAAIHLLVWLKDRSGMAHLWFSLLASSLASFAGFELALMHTESVATYTSLHQLAHIAMFGVVVSLVGFVHAYFGTGRRWLFRTVVALRVIILVLAFHPGPTFNFSEIESLVSFSFLGESVSVASGVPSPWARVGELSALLALVFVIDSAIRLWRRGNGRDRQRALIVGGAVIASVALTLTFSLLFHTGKIQAPYAVSVTFMLIVAAMGYELSRDLIHAGQLANDLEESVESMRLAANAAHLALWRWDIVADRIWVNPEGRGLYGIQPDEPIDLDRFLATLHPDDRESTHRIVSDALRGDGDFQASYRVVRSAGDVRWIEARGQTDFGPRKVPIRMRGVSIDATEKSVAEGRVRELRQELSHAGRVSLLGQLSSALAHELHQPLGAILRNCEAAEMMLTGGSPDLEEIGAIIADIHADDRRAASVIDRLRSLLKHRRLETGPVSVPDLAEEAVSLVRSDAAAKRVSLSMEMPADLPPVRGDRIHLLQVLLNLVVNAIDAIEQADSPDRRIRITSSRSGSSVELRVRDTGPGIRDDLLDQLFEPFFTTKARGMGIGLPVCQTIIEAHQGAISASNPAGGGAEFLLTLPVEASKPDADPDRPPR